MPTASATIAVPLRMTRESSKYRPAKERDDVRQQWKSSNDLRRQMASHQETVALLSKKLESMRRRILGGAGTTTVQPSVGINYRGVWVANPTSPYMTNDEVLLGTGTSAGMYLSTIDNNTNLPDSGIGWVQVSSFATWL